MPDESVPQTLRVDDRLGLDDWVSEWICLERTGWVRRKGEQWWKVCSPDPVPDSAEEACDLIASLVADFSEVGGSALKPSETFE